MKHLPFWAAITPFVLLIGLITVAFLAVLDWRERRAGVVDEEPETCSMEQQTRAAIYEQCGAMPESFESDRVDYDDPASWQPDAIDAMRCYPPESASYHIDVPDYEALAALAAMN
jgi:hypothetical protein